MVTAVVLLLTACGSNSSANYSTDSSTGNDSVETVTSTEEIPTTELAEATETPASEVNLEDAVEVLSEYTLPDGIGWYTRRFLVIHNNSDTTVDISTSSLAYGTDDSIVSSADSGFDALGGGCTSVMYEAFETEQEISRYETHGLSKKAVTMNL